ncbi:MAG: prepilin peptidase [Spirochaetia bacterium]
MMEIPVNIGVTAAAFAADLRCLRIPDWITLGGTAVLLGIRGFRVGTVSLGTAVLFAAGFAVFAVITGGGGVTGLGDAKLAGFLAASWGGFVFFRILITGGFLLILLPRTVRGGKVPLGLCLCAASFAEVLIIAGGRLW